jgi:nitrogen fixation NifU-like protein
MIDYSAAVWDHFEQPRRAGAWPPDDPDIGTGTAGAPAEGAMIRLQLNVRDGRIVDARFQSYGGGATIACASWVADWAVGKTLQQARALHHTELAAALRLAPLKIRCAVLAEQAIKSAVDDYLTR